MTLATAAPTGLTFEFSFGIDGMTCASCATRVEKALQTVTGVATANVNLATETVSVTGTEQIEIEPLRAAVERACEPQVANSASKPARVGSDR